MTTQRPDWSALAVVICFCAMLVVLLVREAMSAHDMYLRYARWRDLAACAAIELAERCPENETARAVLAAIERDVDPMEER